jgi:hypothetical protein
LIVIPPALGGELFVELVELGLDDEQEARIKPLASSAPAVARPENGCGSLRFS